MVCFLLEIRIIIKKYRNQVSEITDFVHPQFLFNLRCACDLLSYFITFVIVIPVGIFVIDHPIGLWKTMFVFGGIIVLIVARFISNCLVACLLQKKYRKQ